MTSALDSVVDGAGGKLVVAAWEPPRGATFEDHFAAVALLAEKLGAHVAGVLIRWDPDASRRTQQIVELLLRWRVRVLPLLDLRHPEATDEWKALRLPASLATLSRADVLCEFGGIRHAIAAEDGLPRGLDMIAAWRDALAAPGHPARIGWLRRRSADMPTPPALDFALDWPPYASDGDDTSVAVSGPLRDHTYQMVVSDLARRHAGDTLMAPSLLWSAKPEAEVHEAGARVTGISRLRFHYALDIAERFVRNRLARGVPFWVLRAAFAPGDPRDVEKIEELAQALVVPHVPSAVLGQCASLITRAGPDARIAVVIHLYFPDLWPEFATTLEAMPENFDLYVSCPFRVLAATRSLIRRQYPLAVVYGVQNLGRDVLPFLFWLRAVGADAYGYVLKLHGKKSAHIIDTAKTPSGGGDAWRRNSMRALLGDRQRAQTLLRALDDAPDVGVVAPAGYLCEQLIWGCGTGDLVATVLKRLGIECELQGGFAAGTMFWARTAALAPFASLPDAALDFEREAGQIDGNLHHAYERLFALVAGAGGYRVIDSAALLE